MDVAAWSAGQRQLLCMARAILRRKDCKVLILDEAMSSVDADTEELMQQVVDKEFRACTVLAVMHRLAHVSRYDRVVLMDTGKVLEEGATEDLLASHGRFAELYEAHDSQES